MGAAMPEIVDVTLGEVYRLVMHISQRMDQLDYVSSPVYHANRQADRDDVKDVSRRLDALQESIEKANVLRVSERRWLITAAIALLSCAVAFAGLVIK